MHMCQQHLIPSPELILAKGRVTCPQHTYLIHKTMSRNPLLINMCSSHSYRQVLYSAVPGRAQLAGLGQGGGGHKLIIAVRCAVGREIHARNITISHTPKSTLKLLSTPALGMLIGQDLMAGIWHWNNTGKQLWDSTEFLQ